RNGPINFLIIEADVVDNDIVEDEDSHLKLGVFERLPKLDEEVAAMKELLSELKAKDPRIIGEVRVIRKEDVPAGGSFEGLVNEVLNKGTWHVVHYAGHTHLHTCTDSWSEEQTHVGYLIFPGKRTVRGRCRRKAKPVKIDVFASFLRK